MGDVRSRSGMLVGLAAAACAFGAAAMMSTATAPIAHADDFTDIVNAVDGDFMEGQSSFTDAFNDLGSSDLTPGLAAFLSGVDDDLLSPGINLYAGTTEALTNESITNSFAWDVPVATNFTDALSDAQGIFGLGEGYLSDVASALSLGDYGEAAVDQSLGTDYVSIIPLEELLVGALASF
jgi:hypothetical protein